LGFGFALLVDLPVAFMAAEHALKWRLSASVVALCRKSWLPPKWLNDAITGDEDYAVCLVKRSAKSSFMPSSAVFPGGQLDPSDKDYAKRSGNSDPETMALRVAAAREAFEEAGLLFGSPAPTVAARLAARKQLSNGKGNFSESLAAWGIEESSLLTLARVGSFTTPDFEAARHKKGGFVAHFFVAEVPSAEEAALAAADGSEVTQLLWATPSAALRMVEKNELAMAPPQWYILNALREGLPNVEGLGAFLTADQGKLFRDFPFKPAPVKSSVESEMPLALPGDEDHPEFRGPSGKRNRVIMSAKDFKVVRFESTVAYPADAVGPAPRL